MCQKRHDSTARIRELIRNVPVLGPLTWWLYMIVKAPKKMKYLFAEINNLKDRNKSLSSKISRSISEPHEGHGWSRFYNQEITSESMIGNVDHHKYFVDLIVGRANKNLSEHIPKLIEIGVGTGTMSTYLSKTYPFEVVGLDSDPLIIAKAIETNRKLGGHAKFICMDAFDIPALLKPKSFDIAFSQGTMEHFNNDKLQKILQAQLYVAEYVLFSVPSTNYPTEDYGDERRMSKEEWISLIKNLGFKVELTTYYQNDLHVCCIIK